MRGDLSDIVDRLTAVLPKRWFGEQSPNLNALLTSTATPWTWLYKLLSYVADQTRLLTATGEWLDLCSYDYFGPNLARKSNENDLAFRGRVQVALLREAATRSAVLAGLGALTGVEPSIFEPANCSDTGSYGDSGAAGVLAGTGMAYGQAGGWGNLGLALQFFVAVKRPPTPGAGLLAGYGTTNGAYGLGEISYIELSHLPGQVSDEDIRGTLCSLLPVNTVAWLRIV